MNFLLFGVLCVFGFIGGTSLCNAYSGEGQKTLILKSGGEAASNENTSIACVRFAERMKQRTNGKIQITHYADSQLGKWKQILESIRIGSVAMMVSGGASKATELAALPYLFRDGDHARKVFDGEIGDLIGKKHFEQTGVYAFGWFYKSFRHLFTVKTPVNSLANLKGLKIRVAEWPMMVDAWNALGARPTPMPVGDLYLGLRQGVVDGAELTIDFVVNSSQIEVLNNMMLTNHSISANFAGVGMHVWNDLTPETKKVWLDTWREVAEESRMETIAFEDGLKATWKSKGKTIIEPDLTPYRNATKDLWKKYAPQVWGEGVYEKIQAIR